MRLPLSESATAVEVLFVEGEVVGECTVVGGGLLSFIDCYGVATGIADVVGVGDFAVSRSAFFVQDGFGDTVAHWVVFE